MKASTVFLVLCLFNPIILHQQQVSVVKSFILLPRQSSSLQSLLTRTKSTTINNSQNSFLMQNKQQRKHQDAMTISTTALLASPSTTLTTSTSLVRIVFLRAVAFVHAVAFLVALKQNAALIGDNGITPARNVLNKAQERGRRKRELRLEWRKNLKENTAIVSPPGEQLKPMQRFTTKLKHRIGTVIDLVPLLTRLREVLWDRSDGLNRPVTTILWLAKDRTKLDKWLNGTALLGLVLSLTVLILGAANAPMISGMWLCQRSLMAVGGIWYGYGWEPQLAELSFHTLFLVPLWTITKFPAWQIPIAVNFTIRWMLFRIMMGAGLIKLKSGDDKWKDLTVMDYFYETQPVPNPLSRFFHWMPKWWHKCEVLLNHFVELIAPWLLIVPLPARSEFDNVRRTAGMIQLVFQSILITSGNLSFLNWLTMVPAILCFDDAFVGPLFFSPSASKAAAAKAATCQINPVRQGVSWAFLIFIMYLSVPVIKNLCSKRQVMNGSFDPLRIVNTYGAFGVVNEDREEYIISAASSLDGPWHEYEFQVKPGHPRTRPRFLSPYHYRLDWQMWIAATCRRVERSPWIFKFLIKLLERDEGVMRLLANDPWAVNNSNADNSEKPKYIRIDLYRYKFHRPLKGEQNPPYWNRAISGRVYPRQGVATIERLKEEVKNL